MLSLYLSLFFHHLCYQLSSDQTEFQCKQATAKTQEGEDDDAREMGTGRNHHTSQETQVIRTPEMELHGLPCGSGQRARAAAASCGEEAYGHSSSRGGEDQGHCSSPFGSRRRQRRRRSRCSSGKIAEKSRDVPRRAGKGKGKPRPTWSCVACLATCSCKSQLKKHLKGRRHQATVRAVLEKSKCSVEHGAHGLWGLGI